MTKKENPGFLSLNQGQNFNNKQVSNINKQNQQKVKNVQNVQNVQKDKKEQKVQKEGFTTNTDITSTNYKPVLINEYTRMNRTNAQNQSDLSELQSLQSQYNDLLSQYSDLTNQIKGATQENIDRVSPNNPYLSKNATLNNSKGELPVISSGTGGYVTSQGMFKSYPDDNTYSITSGKNGCPTDFIQNVELDKYSKTFIQGKDMIAGQSCGNEGSDVYVSKLNDNPVGTYI